MNKVKRLTLFGLFTAIIILLANSLGYIQLGPIAITTMHIPVLVGAMVFGKKFGAGLGLIFGLTSLFRAYSQPGPTSFIFLNPVIALLPRLALGYLAGWLYQGLAGLNQARLAKLGLALSGLGLVASLLILVKAQTPYSYLALLLLGMVILIVVYQARLGSGSSLASGLAAISATACHSILVLSLIYLFYASRYVEALGLAVAVIVLGALVNMALEMALAALVVPPIVRALEKEVK